MELALNKAGLNSEKQRKFRLKKSDFVFSLKYVYMKYVKLRFYLLVIKILHIFSIRKSNGTHHQYTKYA